MVYAIIPFGEGDRSEFAQRVRSLGPTHEIDSPEIYFLVWNGSLQNLNISLGWNSSSDRIRGGIALPVNSYTGRASNDLWTWLGSYGQ